MECYYVWPIWFFLLAIYVSWCWLWIVWYYFKGVCIEIGAFSILVVVLVEYPLLCLQVHVVWWLQAGCSLSIIWCFLCDSFMMIIWFLLFNKNNWVIVRSYAFFLWIFYWIIFILLHLKGTVFMTTLCVNYFYEWSIF
jgi:hypothetical protein